MVNTNNTTTTTEAKIAQNCILGFPESELRDDSFILDWIHNQQLGGVILYDRNIESPRQLKKLVKTLHEAATNPLFVSIDQEGGQVSRLTKEKGFPVIPSPEKMNLQNIEKYAQENACLLQEYGINLNFAPCVDLTKNPNNFLVQRGRIFSEDPDTVGALAKIWILEHQKHGVHSVLKHFPGHGSADVDTHLGLADISSTWGEEELIPYKKLIEERIAKFIMTAHLFHKKFDDTMPATLSQKVIGGILQKKLGYDGVIITDDLEMGAIANQYSPEEAAVQALIAGVDLLLFANHQGSPFLLPNVVQAIKKAVSEGLIPQKRLNLSHEKVLEVLEIRF